MTCLELVRKESMIIWRARGRSRDNHGRFELLKQQYVRKIRVTRYMRE